MKTHRWRRLTVAVLAGVLAVLALAMPAGAWGVSWCRADPIVEIQGYRAQILVDVPAEAAPWVNGPIDVRIDTPYWMTRKVIFTDAGFNGHGEKVGWGNLSGAVRLTVKVPMDSAKVPAGAQVPVKIFISTPWGSGTLDGVHTGTTLTVPLY